MNTDFNESHLLQTLLKEKQPKETILSSFTHPHVVLKLQFFIEDDVLKSVKSYFILYILIQKYLK